MAKKRNPVKTRHVVVAQALVVSPVSFALGLLVTLVVGLHAVQKTETSALHTQALAKPAEAVPTPFPYAVPVEATPSEPLWLSARAALVVDVISGTYLYAKNTEAELAPASTTKIMTALVAWDTFSPNQELTVTTGPDSVGNKAELVAGERFRVNDLLAALLISSGNDAAVTLAQNHPQGYTGFIEAMNQKAAVMGLKHTHFTNASGIDSAYHYVSARDMAVMALAAYNNAALRPILGTKAITLTSLSGYRHTFYNTNLLLGQVAGVTGIKTGWTEAAGECLVTYLDRDQPLVMVVLGSTDRFGETKKLISWIDRNFRWLKQDELSGEQIASQAGRFKL